MGDIDTQEGESVLAISIPAVVRINIVLATAVIIPTISIRQNQKTGPL